MRIVGYVKHPEFKITIMHMNHRYAIKFENGSIEQTYKVRESDTIANAAAVKELVTEEIVSSVSDHFKAMESTRVNMISFSDGEEEEFEEII